MRPRDPLDRLRALCLALPETHEAVAWGEPTFRVRNRMFAMHARADSHHGAGRQAVWLNAAPENQTFLVGAAPDRIFVPPYVGPKGWIGVWLDGACDWDELADLVRDAWQRTAPKRLAAQVAAAQPPVVQPSATPAPLPAAAAPRRRRA